ncbi:MAG: alcohol dehydrogenase [Actinomycetota bacterium]|nr:MAG: alcohol dehydrogenase [Actinomycetota bacterium]
MAVQSEDSGCAEAAGDPVALSRKEYSVSSRAAVLEGPRRLQLRRIAIPDELPAGAALVRIEGGGMCGTDVHQYRGLAGAAGQPPPYPMVLGHEPVGVIERLSPDASPGWGVSVGDRVAVEPTASCGVCPRCAAGQRHQCPDRQVYSYLPIDRAPSLWGAYADYLVVLPGTVLHPMPAHVEIADAVFFNPLAAALSWTIDVGGTQRGEDVLVIGPGQRGLASIIALKEAGAGRIIVAGRERDGRKFDIARSLGATDVLEDLDVADAVLDITGGRGVHRAFDFTPAPDALRLAVAATGRGGTVMYVARHGEAGLPADDLLRKELTVKTALGAESAAFAQAVAVLASGRHDLSALHTHRIGLDDVDLAVRILAGEVDGQDAIHVTVVP